MIYTVKKNRHRATPLNLGIWKNKTLLKRSVTFLNNSIYPLQDGSIHKLFGIGFFWDLHRQSARIGWRYEGSGIFKLFAYCYVDGKRIKKEICNVPMNIPINCSIQLKNNLYIFKIFYNSSPVSIVTVSYKHNKKWSFPLNLYYGGPNKAPNEIQVKIEKV